MIQMANVSIITDSGCDLSPELLKEWGVKFCSLSFIFDGDEKIYTSTDLTPNEFYGRMRKGEVAKTSGVNIEDFKNCFEEELKAGNDVIYLGFSSGLSVTYNSAKAAADEIRASYPERKLYTIDTLCASAGLGLLVYLAKEKKEAGEDADAIADYISKLAPDMAHWFTVDDLVYLKRGGRVSATTAVIGGILNIKPVMHVDDEGHLINMFKARGRKQSIKMLADKYGELAKDHSLPIFISQADCFEDAEALENIIKAEYGAEVSLITDISPVVGAHAGPGTIALFFIAKER